MFDDPNYYNKDNRFMPYMDPYSIRRRYLFGRYAFEYIIKYGETFWMTCSQDH